MEKNTKVKILSSKVVYTSKWLTLRKDEIIKPDGTPATYEFVERRDIVTIVAKDKESFYLVEQYRYAVGSRSLEFPQGFIDEHETPEQAARRELQEEVGVKAKTIEYLNTLWVTSGYSTQQAHIFLAEHFEKSVQRLDNTEGDLTVKKYTYWTAPLLPDHGSSQISQSERYTVKNRQEKEKRDARKNIQSRIQAHDNAATGQWRETTSSNLSRTHSLQQYGLTMVTRI